MKKSGVRRGVLVYKGPDPAGKMEIPDHTVVDKRPDLLQTFIHRSHPCQLQLVHVATVNLVEWTKTLEVVGAMHHQAVGWVRIEQHLVGDRYEVLGPAEAGEAQDCNDTTDGGES